jgi:hypothetical protein
MGNVEAPDGGNAAGSQICLKELERRQREKRPKPGDNQE